MVCPIYLNDSKNFSRRTAGTAKKAAPHTWPILRRPAEIGRLNRKPPQSIIVFFSSGCNCKPITSENVQRLFTPQERRPRRAERTAAQNAAVKSGLYLLPFYYKIKIKGFEKMNVLKEKRVADSETKQVQVIFDNHLNGQGRLFGGQLASWIDIVAGVVARRHSNCNVTTAEIDTLQFKQPVFSGNLIVLHGKITYVGNTSMEVRVDSYVEDLSGNRKLVNTAYLVLVALDENGKPITVPRLICETPDEEAEWAAGEKRRLLRQKRRSESF
jgi:Acyl-CoA hydrolase